MKNVRRKCWIYWNKMILKSIWLKFASIFISLDRKCIFIQNRTEIAIRRQQIINSCARESAFRFVHPVLQCNFCVSLKKVCESARVITLLKISHGSLDGVFHLRQTHNKLWASSRWARTIHGWKLKKRESQFMRLKCKNKYPCLHPLHQFIHLRCVSDHTEI